MNNENIVNVEKLSRILNVLIPARMPVLILGRPGIGKSEVVYQVAGTLGYEVITLLSARLTPEMLSGYPTLENGVASMTPFGVLAQLIHCEKPTVVFLDEIGQALVSVQNAIGQLVLAREINGMRISDDVTFVLATNRQKDQSGCSTLVRQLISRCYSCTLELTETKAWVVWARNNGINKTIIGFVTNYPASILEDNTTKGGAYCCPRTLTMLSRALDAGLLLEDSAGFIGEDCASQLVSFKQMVENLPRIAEFATTPEIIKTLDLPSQVIVLRALPVWYSKGKLHAGNVREILANIEHDELREMFRTACVENGVAFQI